jgi:Ca2+-binding RTX toxin-like protein
MSSKRLRSVIATGAVLAASAGLSQLGTASAQAAVATCHGHRATIVARVGQKVVEGTNHRDVIVGNSQQNVIHARGGNDLICGKDNADRIIAGSGDDRVWGQGGADVLLGGSGDDHLNPGSGKHFANLMNGGPGDDVLVSVDPDDAFWFKPSNAAGAPPVRVNLAAGTATGQGHDTLRLTAQPSPQVVVPPGSVVHGTAYDDELVGSGSVFYGGKGADRFYTSDSVVHGGPGADLFASSTSGTHQSSTMALYGGPGNDKLEQTVVSFKAHVTLDGGAGSDFVDLYLQSRQPAAPFPSLSLDLAAQALTAPGVSIPVRGLEAAYVHLGTGVADAFTFDGTDQADRLREFGDVPTTVDARGGDDAIDTDGADDTVLGGPGDDTADTGGGQDTCTSVEHATHCETVNP